MTNEIKKKMRLFLYIFLSIIVLINASSNNVNNGTRLPFLDVNRPVSSDNFAVLGQMNIEWTTNVPDTWVDIDLYASSQFVMTIAKVRRSMHENPNSHPIFF